MTPATAGGVKGQRSQRLRRLTYSRRQPDRHTLVDDRIGFAEPDGTPRTDSWRWAQLLRYRVAIGAYFPFE